MGATPSQEKQTNQYGSSKHKEIHTVALRPRKEAGQVSASPSLGLS